MNTEATSELDVSRGSQTAGKGKKKSAEKGNAEAPTQNPFDNVDALFDNLGTNNSEYDFMDRDEDDDDAFEDERVPQTTFELELVTINAQMAWFGKPATSDSKGFPGMEWFVRRSSRLCRFVCEDDPYAMRAALEIEQLIGDIHRDLNDNLEKTSKLLETANRDGLKFTGVSKDRYEKKVVGLEPKNGYALAGARLVGRYDSLVLQAHLCRDMAQLSTKEYYQMKDRKYFRALTWKLQTAIKGLSGATRQDFRSNTGNAKHAYEKHGELPDYILDENFELGLMEILSDNKARDKDVEAEGASTA